MQPPPPYDPSAQPAPYLTTPPEAHQALLRRGKRDIAFGVLWIAFGLFITLFTMARYGPLLVVAWGPAAYGIYKVIRGTLTLRRNA